MRPSRRRSGGTGGRWKGSPRTPGGASEFVGFPSAFMPAVSMLRLMASAQIPPDMIDLLEGDALGHLATIRADGTPHVTPLWIDHDGDTILVDVRVDRVKAANMRERPSVALSIVDPRNPYRHLDITGRAVSSAEVGLRERLTGPARR